jgi:dinuclear metal center YbgI/SA1388 family protein
MNRKDFEITLNGWLRPEAFSDAAINGLQVEGREEIRKVATGVSACAALFREALAWGADAVVVHHGLLWKGMDLDIRLAHRERLKLLLAHDLNLFAWHLPLDAHPELGNNAQIAKKLGLADIEPFGAYHGTLIGMKGMLHAPLPELLARVRGLVGEPVIHLPGGPETVRTVGVVSGGAQREFIQAPGAGLDAYLTGEISEYNVELAAELKCHFIAAGHYRTERFGIQALTERIHSELKLEARYFDLPHPY